MSKTGALSEQEKNTIEQCLREGFSADGRIGKGSRGSAVREAARRLGIPPSTLQSRANSSAGDINWLAFNIVQPQEYKPVDIKIPPVPPEPADPIEIRRRDDTISFLKAALKDAERRALDALDIRQNVLGLTKEPLKPRLQLSKQKHPTNDRQAVIIHLSDLHAGEVIRAPEILGSNRYDLSVFRARLGRLFQIAADLCTRHWPVGDNQPDQIIICLGGDLVSGSIHPELAETNEGTDYQILKEVAEHIAGGIKHLWDQTKVPITVYSVPGNHGRMTLKPQAKRSGLMSWDTLVADLAEASLQNCIGITWHRSEGSDCYFDVLGWPILLTHGDRMGSGGGQGFIGPMAPIARGHQKVSHSEYRQRRPIYLILSAHYHTTVKTPWGWGNGSLVGYNEYVRANRGEPEPAQQNMLVIHEQRGLIRYHPLYVGDPSEGTLYQGAAGWRSPFARMEDVDEEKADVAVSNKVYSKEELVDTLYDEAIPRRRRHGGLAADWTTKR